MRSQLNQINSSTKYKSVGNQQISHELPFHYEPEELRILHTPYSKDEC